MNLSVLRSRAMSSPGSFFGKVGPAFLAGILLLGLLGLADVERPLPRSYVGDVEVVGPYTRQDVVDLLRAVRAHAPGDKVRRIIVPREAARAFSGREVQVLPADVAEAWAGGPLVFSAHTVRKGEAGWTVVASEQWIR